LAAPSFIAGQAHIETGLRSDVRSMAGNVFARGRRRYAVVMLIDDTAAHQGQPAMDALLQWVYEGVR
jgi:serine-type D-Ala-D-Ala carboxypeptidase/endopeptidase (penicillin-binding protein 4)